MAELRASEPPAEGDEHFAVLVRHESDVARAWLAAFVGAQPLEEIGSLPLAELAHDAGMLARAVARAPGCEAPGSTALRHAGRGDAARVVRAGELLRSVCWRMLCEELGDPGGELADRLAAACSDLVAAALSGASPADYQSAVPARTEGLVIFDEHAGRIVADSQAPAPPLDGARVRARDARRDAPGENPRWGMRIRAQLDRFHAEGLPFSLLLAELMDLQLLSAAEPPAALERVAAAVADAIAFELSPRDGEIVSERPGRWWIVCADSDRPAARRTAERLARAARAVSDGRGDPLELAVGVAVSPPDGQEFRELSAQADVAMFAARSQARSAGGG